MHYVLRVKQTDRVAQFHGKTGRTGHRHLTRGALVIAEGGSLDQFHGYIQAAQVLSEIENADQRVLQLPEQVQFQPVCDETNRYCRRRLPDQFESDGVRFQGRPARGTPRCAVLFPAVRQMR